MAKMGFLKDFRKAVDKLDSVTTKFSPPTHWYHTGNYAINRILSGSFRRGIPQGRISILAGPSGAGKSFLLCNIIREAQKDGAFILVIDSENALDQEFMSKLDVDTSDEALSYVGVTIMQDVTKILSEFLGAYEKEYGKDNPDSPKILIVIDSLDMLLTESEEEKFENGIQKGDQGQRAKILKHLLRTLVVKTSRLNCTTVATHQVYPADPLAGEGSWALNNGVRYSASQIALITKLRLKEDAEIVGIRMRVETFKSRFAKLGSKVEVEVPYSRGMDPLGGVLDLLIADGIITQGGAWYSCSLPGEDLKFQRKNFDKALFEKILTTHPKLVGDESLIDSTLEDEPYGADEKAIAESTETV